MNGAHNHYKCSRFTWYNRQHTCITNRAYTLSSAGKYATEASSQKQKPLHTTPQLGRDGADNPTKRAANSVRDSPHDTPKGIPLVNSPLRRTSRRDDKVNTALIRLLRIRAEPEPLQDTLARDGALSSDGGVGRDGDVEVCVVGRELGEVLVGVAVEDDERLAEDLVGGRLDDGDVAGPLVRDGQDGAEVDDLAG